MFLTPFIVFVSVLLVSGCLAIVSITTNISSSLTVTTTTTTSTTISTTSDCLAGPPAVATANQQDGAVAASIAARRRYDANKVVITIGGERLKGGPLPPKPLTPDWEKRLSAGRKFIEEQAKLMQLESTTTTVSVASQPGLIDDRLPPRKTNLQRSKIVQTLSIPGESAPVFVSEGLQPKRITTLKALQRLKSTLSTPSLDQSTVQRLELLNGGGGISHQVNGKRRNSRRRSSSGADETDASVLSSYQPLEVDLDDDAIMV